MADKLGDDNVTQFPARAAKGAGNSKPRKPAAEAKPRIPVGRAGVRARPKSPDDERALRDALQLQLVGLRSKHTAVDQKIAGKREEIRELNETRKVIRAAIETAGMPLALFDEAYEDGKTSRVDLARKEASRSIVREAYGLPVGTQGELFTGEEKTPEAAKPAIYWEAEGYRCGIAGLDPENMPKPPPEHVTDFQRGINQATSRNAEGLTAVKKAEGKARTPIHRPGQESASVDEAAELDAAKKSRQAGVPVGLKAPAHANSAVLADHPGRAAAGGDFGGEGPEKHDDEEEGIEDEEEEDARHQGDPQEPAPDVLTEGAEGAAAAGLH